MITPQEIEQHKINESVARELTDKGYRRTSRKFCIVSRIDREDWKEFMADKHAPWSFSEGISWVHSMLESGAAQDHFRRCYSKDKIKLSKEIADMIPCSSHDRTGYVK